MSAAPTSRALFDSDHSGRVTPADEHITTVPLNDESVTALRPSASIDSPDSVKPDAHQMR